MCVCVGGGGGGEEEFFGRQNKLGLSGWCMVESLKVRI